MRHLKSGRKLGRSPSHRRALLRNLAISLLEHERIITTREKAKEVQRLAERLINLGKKGGLHNLRLALARLPHKPTVMKLFHDIGPRYSERAGGYTRIVKMADPRLGDRASQVVLELVERRETGEKKKS